MNTEHSAGLQPDVIATSKGVNVLTLFTSTSTLVCCALPALLVTVGAGAALSSLISAVPQLVWVSEHKPLVFGFAGAMLLVAGLLQWQSQHAPCPADPALAAVCARTRRNSLRIYWLSAGIYLVGAWFAFVAPLLM